MAIPDVRTPGLERLQHGKRTIIITTTISFFLLERIGNPSKVEVSPAASRWKWEASQSWTFAITSDLKSNSLQHFIAASAGKSLDPGTDTKQSKTATKLHWRQKKTCPVPTLELQHRSCLVCYVVWGAAFASLLMHDVWVRTSQLTFQSSSYISRRPTRTLNTLQWNSHSLPLQARIPLISLSRGARLSHCLVTD